MWKVTVIVAVFAMMKKPIVNTLMKVTVPVQTANRGRCSASGTEVCLVLFSPSTVQAVCTQGVLRS